MDPIEVDDVQEVPAHYHINAANGREGDVLSVNPRRFCDGDVCLSQFPGLVCPTTN